MDELCGVNQARYCLVGVSASVVNAPAQSVSSVFIRGKVFLRFLCSSVFQRFWVSLTADY
jgi:hypothetical protein